MNISELVIYRNLKHEDLFEDMAGLMALLLSALPCRQ